ncbi:GNAT family N-acetyltransferase [Asanoa sp. WMMD1127]|uniref:GNAT family N-acetyltransferase n=1 Tax=Asanoa sp. WMMD1127 TaxID=3016107 RepID=UPI00241803B3|nr:GNAT family N-acetyltransferase [Asanoa sp. WMMD1127]MDG4827293.1 GNAT family N-acetyltransferase [Asanoa sp. WMMD1127]
MLRSVHDRAELAALLRKDAALHAYELGDLDDFFWPYTTWYRLRDTLALLYHGQPTPTLLAFGADEPLGDLLAALRPLLPRAFYAHLSPGAGVALAPAYTREHDGGPHLKMALGGAPLGPAEGEPLGPADLAELEDLYAAAYPGNWFDRRMLETGQYVGIRRAGRIVAVAGVHVWSPVYRVSAIGNVTVHPDRRGQGLAQRVTAALCHRLRATTDVVTLNVKTDNAAAVAAYRKIGFTTVGHYEEATYVSASAEGSRA